MPLLPRMQLWMEGGVTHKAFVVLSNFEFVALRTRVFNAEYLGMLIYFSILFLMPF